MFERFSIDLSPAHAARSPGPLDEPPFGAPIAAGLILDGIETALLS